MTPKFSMAIVGLLSLSLAACDIHSSTYLYDDDHPHHTVVVEQAPPPPGAVVVQQPTYVEPAPIVVTQEAPAVPEEVIVARPGPEFVWVGGYYNWDHEHWVLVRGHWERPPHTGARWIPPHTERHGNEVHFSAGVWR
jgi:hypothetical protein